MEQLLTKEIILVLILGAFCLVWVLGAVKVETHPATRKTAEAGGSGIAIVLGAVIFIVAALKVL